MKHQKYREKYKKTNEIITNPEAPAQQKKKKQQYKQYNGGQTDITTENISQQINIEDKGHENSTTRNSQSRKWAEDLNCQGTHFENAQYH